MAAYGTLTVTSSVVRGDLGQAARLVFTAKDATGLPVDPATLSVTVYGAGSTLNLTISQLIHDSTGLYHYDFQAAAAGQFAVTAVTTVPNAAGDVTFTVDTTTRTGRLLGSGHMTVAEFRAIPTRIAVDQLIVNQVKAAQENELADVLARASQWADDYCVLPNLGTVLGSLAAVTGSIMRQAHTDPAGDVRIAVGVHPKIPVQVTAAGYGYSRTTLSTLTDLSSVLADQGLVTVNIGGYTGSWRGALQFGAPVCGQPVWLQLGLTVGWPNTQLATPVTAGSATAVLSNTVGIVAGTVLEVTDPGSEEKIVVLSVSGNTITLVGTFASAHDVGVGFTAIPPDVREAVAYAACHRLVTPGMSGNPLPGAAVRDPKTSTKSDQSYQAQAQALLAPFRRRIA